MNINSSRQQSPACAPAKSLALFSESSAINALPGSLNDDFLVRRVITACIKRCGKSREQIADLMSKWLGVQVTARMITSFTAESKELHRWPGAWDRAFSLATGDDSLLRCRAEAAGYQLIRDEEVLLLDLGRQLLRRKRADEQAAILEHRLADVEEI